MFEVGKYYYISDFDGYKKWYKENKSSLVFLCDETDVFLCGDSSLEGVNTSVGIFLGARENDHSKFFSEFTGFKRSKTYSLINVSGFQEFFVKHFHDIKFENDFDNIKSNVDFAISYSVEKGDIELQAKLYNFFEEVKNG